MHRLLASVALIGGMIANGAAFSAVAADEANTGDMLQRSLADYRRVYEDRQMTTSQAEINYGVGLLVGAKDIAKAAGIICIPDGVTLGQIAQVVLVYLNSNPERLHETASILVVDALVDVWPCDFTAS